MKSLKGIVVAFSMLVVLVSFASASSHDKDAMKPECKDKTAMKSKCKGNAVEHCKTARGEEFCPVAVWAAEAIGPNGEVLNEAVAIWQLSDGSTWIAKQVKPATNDKKAMVTQYSEKVQPMTKQEAMNDTSKDKTLVVKSAHKCKDMKNCTAKEHTRSVDGKTVMCSKVDTKAQASNVAADHISKNRCFTVKTK